MTNRNMFRDIISSGRFAVTSEIGPPKGTDVLSLLDDVAAYKSLVDAVNVTDSQSSVMRLGSLAVSHLLTDLGIEPIFQMTCRDRNRLALQSDLLSAHVLGVKNILVLTGDHPVLGDHPDAKPVFDLDAVTLLATISALNGGQDLAGKPLKGKPDFFPGAVVNPGSEPLEPELIKLEKKIEAGARFIQTQAIFDERTMDTFMSRVKRLKVPVLAGIVLLKSPEMANYMNKNVAGIKVPDALIKEIADTADRKKESVVIAARLIKSIRQMVSGIHIMPIGWDKQVPEVIMASGLDKR